MRHLLTINQLKHRLEEAATKAISKLSEMNGQLASTMFGYQDLLFSDLSLENASEIRTLTCLHALNHVFKTRDKVVKNNGKLSQADGSEDVEYRDQGFTRPKVLMLLPTRNSCAKVVDAIIKLSEPDQQENKKRFQDAYVQAEDQFSEDKPMDFRDLFEGNDDDMFRVGMKFNRKNVKFFSQFYNSDIIFASPLGLRMAIGAEDDKKQDYDFLSSIEVVLVHQADALLMQNWEHVEYIFEHLNLQPTQTHGADFGRVRNWYLDGHSKYMRQSIVLSAFNTPELNKLCNQHMSNLAGVHKISKSTYEGAMLGLEIQVKQTFSRFEALEPASDPDERFKFFTSAVVPSVVKLAKASAGNAQGILIFIPSYMDFVRVRNFMANSSLTESVSFGSISEYTPVREVARARSHFFSGRHAVLLYTGRAHHFRRYKIRGVKKVIMYALSDNPLFYQEIVGGYLARSSGEAINAPGEGSVRSLFSNWDALRLERIVGTKRFVTMLREKGGDTFDFL
jgi:U3 small nucleolar RNA-associated protein 25